MSPPTQKQMRKAAVAAAAALFWGANSAEGLSVAQPPQAALRRLRSSKSEGQRLALAQTRSDNVPKNYVVTNLRTLPHVDKPWTQGLEFSDDGELVETSGDYPTGSGSYVRILDQETGMPTKKITDGLASPVFIEGISELNGRWFASTYEDHVALEYDKDFNLVKSHPFPWEGWGLARGNDGKSFYATNSSEWLLHLDADKFELLSEAPVTCRGKRVPGLNELEAVDNFLGHGPAILGNVINTRIVLVIDPATAECTGVFHLNDLEPVSENEKYGNHVANGIAFNKKTGNYWITGKNWDSLFEVSLAEDMSGLQSDAVALLDMHLSRLSDW